jgi:hypothetical protein
MTAPSSTLSRLLVAGAALSIGTAFPEGAPLGPRPLAAQIFHSSHAANLPTTATLPAGDLLFEISHRFTPPVSEGSEAFWGLDGPVINRLGLAYALTDAALLGVRRSNLADNVELWAGTRLLEAGTEELPLALGVTGAIAWNTASTQGVTDGRTENETQAYLQGVLDIGLGETVSVGIVPTYLHNPRIRDLEADDAFVLGLHGRVLATDNLGFIAEWIVSEERQGRAFDSGAFGLEIRTRGHFFKLLLTNQVRMNPSQLLGGSAVEFTPDEWRLGFNITRRIVF